MAGDFLRPRERKPRKESVAPAHHNPEKRFVRPASPLTPEVILQLQSAVGNHRVQDLLLARRTEPTRESAAPAFPWIERGSVGQERTTAHDVQRDPVDATPSGPDWDASKAVTPTYDLDKPAPTRSNTAPSTTQAGTSSLPTTFTGHAAVDKAGKVWRYQLDTVTSKGKMQLVYYTNDHYPAPTPTDDSGDLSNVTKDNWKDIVKDLKDNRSGVPDFWSAYRREIMHETYHWTQEWQKLASAAVKSAEGDIAKLSLGFDKAATSADAEKALKPQATKIFDDAIKKAHDDWFKMGDDPGDPPYVAQAPALDDLRARVEKEAHDQKGDTP